MPITVRSKAMEEYIRLKQQIAYHMDRYYNQDDPEITDLEYDMLMQDLKRMEREHPEWVTPDSPTQRVGGAAGVRNGTKVVHNVPMLSIEDVFTREEVAEWTERVLAMHPGAEFSVEHKIDGLSMTLRYRREAPGAPLTLFLAETRGTGFEGDDCTANALMIRDVPRSLDLPGDYLELRGEVYMTHAAFEAYNAEQERAGRKTAANARNLAAGTLRLLDGSLTEKRGLSMFIFNVQDGARELMTRHISALDRLEAQGVPCVPRTLCRTPEEVLKAIDRIGEERGSIPYDIDGAVVKLDQIDYRADFPAGTKYSAGHIAYKYPPEERVVVMDEILVDVGRTGKLSFTGVFHDRETGGPARLCGTDVTRATLHNQDYITDMSIGIGGAYKVYKSGEIIPRLNGCVEPPPQVFHAPENCPVCGSALVREEDTADIRCVNPSCPAQLARTVSYFASVGCMKIDALGDKLIEALIEAGYLHSYADIYTLKDHREELIAKGMIGKEKNTDRILAAIEASKASDPVRLLTGLGIRNVGAATARAIMEHYSGIRELAAATAEELTAIPDVGGITAACIADFFADPRNREILDRLEASGVNMKMPERTKASDRLQGMTIAVTGTLPTLGRKEIEELIAANGGRASGSVSRKTTYLVAGEAAGSKLTKARELGVPVLTEEEFLMMIRETDGEESV